MSFLNRGELTWVWRWILTLGASCCLAKLSLFFFFFKQHLLTGLSIGYISPTVGLSVSTLLPHWGRWDGMQVTAESNKRKIKHWIWRWKRELRLCPHRNQTEWTMPNFCKCLLVRVFLSAQIIWVQIKRYTNYRLAWIGTSLEGIFEVALLIINHF